MKKIVIAFLIIALGLYGLPDLALAKNRGMKMEAEPGKYVAKVAGEKYPRLIQVPRGKTIKSIIDEKLKGKKVQYIEPDFVLKAFQYPNDPLRRYQWNLNKERTDQALDIVHGERNLKIAIVDTGVDSNHPDLRGKVESGFDFINQDSDAYDDYGHGTEVSGVAAALTGNKLGVSSLAGFAKIVPVKVLDSYGMGDAYGVSSGIIFAADSGAKVINLSLGGPSDSRAIHEAVSYAYEKGCVIVAAAGNDGQGENAPQYPASYSEVISVASTSSNDLPSYFSNHDSNVDVSAPGENILSTSLYGYDYFSGTSASAPQVTALAALLISKSLNASVDNVAKEIKRSAKDLGSTGWDEYYGSGRIDAYHAVSGTPYVVRTNPENEGSTLRKVISIYFSHKIDRSKISSSSFILKNQKGKRVKTRTIIRNKVATVRASSLDRGIYTLTVKGIRSNNGGTLAAPYVFRFRIPVSLKKTVSLQ